MLFHVLLCLLFTEVFTKADKELANDNRNTYPDTAVFDESYWERNSFENQKQKRSNLGCEHSCMKEIPNCYCDEACPIFNDCCFKSDEPKDNNTLLLNKSEIICDFPYTFPLIPKAKSFPFAVWMIKNCSKYYTTNSVSIKCSGSDDIYDPLEYIPVSDSDGLTYRNIFCALCNGVTRVFTWRPITFDLISLPTTTNLYNILHFVYQPDKKKQIFPIPSLLIKPRICLRLGSRDADISAQAECKRYQRPVYIDGTFYKNIECANKHSITCQTGKQVCRPECIDGLNKNYIEYVHGRTVASFLEIRFNLQLDFSDDKCRLDDARVGLTGKCFRFGCLHDPETLKSEATCQTYQILYTKYKLKFSWYYVTDKDHYQISRQRYISIILYILYVNDIASVRDYFPSQIEYNGACTIRRVGGYFRYAQSASLDKIVKVQQWIDSVQFTYTEIDTNGDSITFKRVFQSCGNTSHSNVNRIYFTSDRKSVFASFLRYGSSFLLMNRCTRIHLNLLVENNVHVNGNNYLKYKPLEFYCDNVLSGYNLKVLLIYFCLSIFAVLVL